jgi:hypothetical protein
MRLAESILAIGMALSLSGCVLHRTPIAKAAPPAPKPTVTPAPAPPPEPLSIPQTNVELPSPQPISPEALATTQPAGEPLPPPPPVRAPRPPRTGGTPARTEATPGATPAAPPAAEPAHPLVSEVTPAAELKRLQDEAAARRQEVTQLIRRIPRSRLRQQQNSVDRINVFLKQAEDAERRGDMRQASELAGRALVLARELK